MNPEAVLPATMPRWRLRLIALVESTGFRRLVIALIVLSAVFLGLETVRALPPFWLDALHAANRLILAFFVLEIVLRILAHRGAFFRDGWSLFDLAIVLVAVIPPPGPMQMLRALRIVRAGRLLSAVPTLRRVVDGLLHALPGLGAIIVLLTLILYGAAVMATHLYRDISSGHFGDLGRSLLTLFQVMTLENWPDIAAPLMAVDPWAWVYFVGFILVSTFIVLNLFIGVVVSAIQSKIAIDLGAELDADSRRDAALARDVAALREEIVRLRQSLRDRGNGPDAPAA